MDAYHQSLYVSYQNSGKYTTAQLRELEIGLEQALQVGFYANSILLPEQMAQIRIGLEHGIDVTSYSGAYWYHYLQMAELRLGLEAGIDISYYDDVSFSTELMRIIRMGLEAGLDVVWYANPIYSISQASLIYEGLRQGLDVSFYANPSYESEQMLVIKKGLESNLDVSLYTDSRFSFMQMTQIRQGLELGIDVRIYAKLDYDEKQMWQIKAGLIEKLDISCYANPAFHANQMQEIRLGLKSGIDISLYCDPLFTYEEMRQIRTIFTRHRKTKNHKNRSQTQLVIQEETIERLSEKKEVPSASENQLTNSRNEANQLQVTEPPKPMFEQKNPNQITNDNKSIANEPIPEKDILNTEEIEKPSLKRADFRSNRFIPTGKGFIQEPQKKTVQPNILLPAPAEEMTQPIWHPSKEKEQTDYGRNHTANETRFPPDKPVFSGYDTEIPANKHITPENLVANREQKDSPMSTEKPVLKPSAASSGTARMEPTPSMQTNIRPAGAPQEPKKRHNVFYNMTKAANAGRPAISPRELFTVNHNADT